MSYADSIPRGKIKVEFHKINCYLRPACDNPQFMPPLTVNMFPTLL